MKWVQRENRFESVDYQYVIEKKNNGFQLYIYNYFSDHEIIEESEDFDKLKKIANKHRLNEKKKITCIHCNKKKDNHRSRDMACPIGSYGRIGYTSYSSENIFESKLKDQDECNRKN